MLSQALNGCSVLLTRADAPFKTLMTFFSSCLVLHLPGLYNCTVLWVLSPLSPLRLHPTPPYLSRLSLCVFFFLGVVTFSVLKQVHQGKQYTMFGCVLTPRLHRAWFPRGKWAFGMFTFCSLFYVASKPLSISVLLPNMLETRRSQREKQTPDRVSYC